MTLLEQLELHEGRKAKPYVDSVGKLTIGVGRNLTDKGLSEDEIDFLLGNDLKECREDLQRFGWWADLNDARRNAMLDMRFNLGPSRFRRFRLMLAAVATGDYHEASRQMERSTWATQVGFRAVRLARMMRDGISE